MAKSVQAAMVVVLTLSWCKAASAQMVLYDNFHTGVINPAKWVGAQNYDPDIREAVRQPQAFLGMPTYKGLHLMDTYKGLHIMERAYSATTDNNGFSGGLFGLAFRNPSAVTAIKFSLVVNKISVVPCSTNAGIGQTSAEFRGSFFNIDASPTSAGHDVRADINIGQTESDSRPTVKGFVQEGDGTVLGYQVLGTVALGITYTLFVQWDQPNHRFVFQLNNGAEVFEPYSVSDTSPPFYAFKNIDLARVMPHCTSTPQPSALVDADFDDVYVNEP